MGGLAYSLISTGRGTPSSATAIPSTLTGSMAKYVRGINNRRFDMNNPYDGTFDIKVNERVRVDFINDTTMWHPMHLHGHTFQLAGGGARSPREIAGTSPSGDALPVRRR